MPQQPDWMELIKPNPNYEEIDESNFKYDDGGPEIKKEFIRSIQEILSFFISEIVLQFGK
jgi:hypothetical protein